MTRFTLTIDLDDEAFADDPPTADYFPMPNHGRRCEVARILRKLADEMRLEGPVWLDDDSSGPVWGMGGTPVGDWQVTP